VDSSIVPVRELMIEALRNRAVNIILLHNHPSGDPFPSPEDRTVTKKVSEAGNLVGIRLADHIIIGDNTYYSFKEWGLL
jgi:DNA repair protein RadC